MKFFIAASGLLAVAGCSPRRPEVLGIGGGSSSPTPDTTAPTVTIEQKTGQADPATVDGIDFTLTFSEEINATTLTTADITQNGTATVESWVLTQVNSTTWELSADVVRGSGTVIPSIASSRFADSAGNTNSAASSSSDNSVTYNEPMATVQFTQASSVGVESAGAKTISVTLGAVKAYSTVVSYAPAELYSALAITNLSPSTYTLTIPAGQTSADITYTVSGTDGLSISPVIQLSLSATNSNAVRVGERQIHRQFLTDQDNPHDPIMNVSAGVRHSCGVTYGGVLYCWGLNTSGQLGDGTTTSASLVGVAGAGNLNWLQVSAGGSHTCAIAGDDSLHCWGLNTLGQLGDTTNTMRTSPVLIDSGVSYSAVSAGHSHTCGVTTTGVLKCWGAGGGGRLGTGATANVNTPTVVSLPGGYSAMSVLAAGFNHTCVMGSRVCDPGAEICPAEPNPYIFYQLYCTGSDAVGQLGNGAGSGSNTFTATVDTLVRYIGLSAGKWAANRSFTCGVTEGGTLKCWGDNTYSQLGDGTTSQSNSPVDVGSGYSKVSAGGAGACAVDTSDGLMCWGKMQATNDLSTSSSSYPSSIVPTAIDSGETYTSVAAGGEHRCAITLSGVLKCWGASTNGALGDGVSDTFTSPVEIDPGTTYDSVSVSSTHTCARTGVGQAIGEVRCWGDNFSGQLGDGQGHTRTHPLALTAQTEFKSISAGGGWWLALPIGYSALSVAHTCGVTATDQAVCWGSNEYNQVGNAEDSDATTPVEIDAGEAYLKIASGSNFSCGITPAGALKCWGDDFYEQLGLGAGEQDSGRPLQVDSSIYIDVAAGGSLDRAHACAIRDDGSAYCWGSNDHFQLGKGGTAETPQPVSGGETFTQLSLGEAHSCGVTPEGGLYCWGGNASGQLGDGGTSSSSAPVRPDLDPYLLVDAGYAHTCAITTGGELRCWGANASGQLGDGTTTQRLSPVVIDSGTAYRAVSAGDTHTCGITSDGALKCWGSGAFGLLGEGRFPSWNTPMPVW